VNRLFNRFKHIVLRYVRPEQWTLDTATKREAPAPDRESYTLGLIDMRDFVTNCIPKDMQKPFREALALGPEGQQEEKTPPPAPDD